MKSLPSISLDKPQILDHGPIRLVGLNRRYSDETSANIPNQWSAFSELGLSHDMGFGTNDSFGVLHNADGEGNVDYFCGIEVRSFSDTLENSDRLTLSAQTYAVFAYPGHVADVKRVWSAVWNSGMLQVGLKAAQGPEFERYRESFDPQTGLGGFEIWVPVLK